MTHNPLILTAALDPDCMRVLQGLRDRHFPARLNIVPAHLTLFHALPGAELAAINHALCEACDGEPVQAGTTTGLRFLGRGVAFEIAAPALVAMRTRLAASWHAWLTPQDRQGFKPHVTVQNKVDPAVARALRDDLSAAFQPMPLRVLGLDLWHYEGGPWRLSGHYSFRLKTRHAEV